MHDESLTTTRLTEDDQALLRRLRARDARAIEAIERRYAPELQLFCRRMLNDEGAAEDIVQDVLSTCVEMEAESAPTNSIRGWLYQIARRRCIDLIRKRRGKAAPVAHERRATQQSFAHAIDPCTTPAGRTLKRERATRILSVLDDLDGDLRSIVVMRYFQDLSREQIAEAMDLSARAVKSRIAKAISELRQRLDRLDDSTIR
jgi:RNA polymerase sigma-70 factor (ECF subfamily)